jgi:rRNA maturation RNase YbeY
MSTKESPAIDLRNFTRHKPVPSFPYTEIAKAILPTWDISLVYAGEKRAQHLNATLRGKTYIPNVLSYVSGERSGEIIICLPIAKKQAPTYGLSYTHFTAFLFIHGLLHLKGLPHGATMEGYERSFLKRFTGAILDYDFDPVNHGTPTHRNRH